VLASLPLNTMGAIDHQLPAALPATPYALWGESWLIVVAFLVFILYRIVTRVE
jgi:apolipoprotein N-acyltransferase